MFFILLTTPPEDNVFYNTETVLNEKLKIISKINVRPSQIPVKD